MAKLSMRSVFRSCYHFARAVQYFRILRLLDRSHISKQPGSMHPYAFYSNQSCLTPSTPFRRHWPPFSLLPLHPMTTQISFSLKDHSYLPLIPRCFSQFQTFIHIHLPNSPLPSPRISDPPQTLTPPSLPPLILILAISQRQKKKPSPQASTHEKPPPCSPEPYFSPKTSFYTSLDLKLSIFKYNLYHPTINPPPTSPDIYSGYTPPSRSSSLPQTHARQPPRFDTHTCTPTPPQNPSTPPPTNFLRTTNLSLQQHCFLFFSLLSSLASREYPPFPSAPFLNAIYPFLSLIKNPSALAT